jgi:uncharacterized membrane-anchored protein YhcB (DUF1043 family)
MEAFAIIGFIFGLSAMGTATANAAQVKKLKEELKELKAQFDALQE